MKITFVASEITPFAKTGGLADVAGALPHALYALGHDVRLFMPFYSSISGKHYDIKPVDSIQHVSLMLEPHHYEFSLFSATLPDSTLDVFLVDCPALYARPSLYTYDIDEHRRFLLLQRAVLESCQRMQFAPDIIHCNDWHTALLPLMLKTSYSWDRLFENTHSVFSIHNIAYQGQFSVLTLSDIGIDDIVAHMHAPDLATGHINWMREGIRHAHSVCTVSPTYAKEICTPSGGYSMEDSLRERVHGVTGILNGVDYDSWNPETDKLLPARFSMRALAGKQRCKQALIAHSNLHITVDTPVIGLVSRLAMQKGIDILMTSLPQLLTTRDFALCILGSGETRYVDFFNELATQFPDRVNFEHGYDEPLAHLIESGSDMFLMPSLYEPCGLNQMYSLKYGTVPIVRKTGGLADSVQLWDGESGTGIVFDHYDEPAVIWAVNTALDLFRDKATWQQIMRNGMAMNFSWEKQALEYVELYQKTLLV